MMNLKVNTIELILTFSQKQVDSIERKRHYMPRRLKQALYNVEGVGLVVVRDQHLLIEVDQPEKLEELKSKILSTVIKIIG